MNRPQCILHENNQVKSSTILVRFIQPFDECWVNERLLLPQVLLSGSKDFPTKQAIQLQSDLLYASEISAYTTRYGSVVVTSFQMNVVNPQYIQESDYMDQVLHFLHSIIYRPRTRKGAFLKHHFQLEKRLLKEQLQTVYNDKMEYSYMRFKEEMFRGESYATSEMGILQTIDQCTEHSTYLCYQKMMEESIIEIDLSGSVSLFAYQDQICALFPSPQKTFTQSWIDQETTKRELPQTIRDLQAVKQARLYLGYRTNVYASDEFALAIRLFNTMLGDFEQSVLFQTIREEMKLAYYVQSSLFLGKGYFVIMAGIDPVKEQHAIKAIQEAIMGLQTGQFSDEDFQLAKSYIIEQERRALDSPQIMAHRHFVYRHVVNRPYVMTEVIDKVMKISKAMLMEACQSIRLDTIYILTEATNETI